MSEESRSPFVRRSGPSRRRTLGVIAALLAVTLVVRATRSTLEQTSPRSAPPTSTSEFSLSPSSSSATKSVTSTKMPRSARPYDGMLRATIASLNREWAVWLPELYGERYRKLRGGIYAYRSDSVTPKCDGTRLPYLLIRENAFYCPEDDLIAWDDEGLFPRLSKEHGDLLLGVVLAHEWGHAIQQRAGILDELETITAEQQADCFAGSWLGALDESQAGEAELIALREKNLDRVLGGLVEFRDYVGLDERFAGSHGTAFDRIRAFQEGFESGPERCRDYEDEQPPLVGFAFRDLKERFRGGNLPFADVLPTVVPTFASADSEAGRTVTSFVDVTNKRPVCRDPIRFPLPLSESVIGCLDGPGSVLYNRRGLEEWYDRFGDFSVSTVLGLAWNLMGGDRPK